MNIEEYYEEMPDHRRDAAKVVHGLVLELYPDATISMKYKMPTYESEKGWISIGNQKNYWSVYTCSIDKISDYIKHNPDMKHGKGCLNFRKKDVLDEASMKIVIKKALEGL